MIPPPIIGSAPRNYVGWILLAAIGLPLLTFVNVRFFGNAYAPKTRARTCVDDMKAAIRLGHWAGAETASWETVDSCVAEVAPDRSKSTLSAMVYAASRHEEGRTVSPSDIAVLVRSKFARHRAFAAVYAEDKLTPARARSLVDAMPDTSFVYVLAKVHALEKAGVSGARKRYLADIENSRSFLLFGVLLALAAALLGLALWVAYIGLRVAGLLEPLGHPLGKLSLPDADRCALRAAQYLLMYIGVEVALVSFLPILGAFGIPAPTDAGLLVMHSTLLAIGFLALSYRPLDGKLLRLGDVGITRKRLWLHVGWGVAGEIANVPIIIAASIVSYYAFRGVPRVDNPVVTDLHSATDLLTIVLLGLGACLYAPLIEETWFRGTLLPAFSSVTRKPVWGIAITSVLFASLHPTGLPSWLPLASIGAMGAMLTYQTKSLVPAMVMHGVHNAVTLALTLWT